MSNNQIKARKLGLTTTIAFVIANMVGTGVFTSLGFQIAGIPNPIVILALWVVGGVIALCGSLVYSELGAAMPRSGGEYHYLGQIYHPWVGFLSGWVSMTVGFAAPVALACMALGTYVHGVFPSVSPEIVAIGVILAITFVHTYDIKFGGNFQNIFTSFKVLLILAFIVCGFIFTPKLQDLSVHFKTFSWADFLNPSVAVSLVFIGLAFSGWNASAYIAGEIKNPQRTIPKSLLISTVIVTVLYFMLNLTFLLTAPTADLVGRPEVGLISAIHIFGEFGGNLMGMLISVLLVSTISSMIFVGPRVSQVMGEDMKLFRFLAFKSKKHQTPMYAILLQSGISILFIITASFESVYTYTGFTLMLFTFLAIFGVFVHRARFKNAERPYKTWGYPVVPLIYLVVSVWVLVYTFKEKPKESAFGILTVLSGSIFYIWNLVYERKSKRIDS
jgi:Amino acid transporters